MRLTELGWNAFFNEQFGVYEEQGYSALRIIRENRGKYMARGEHGEYVCEISGKFRFEAESKANFPAVGDWAAASLRPQEMKAVIHALLPRKSSFRRKVTGRVTDEQVIAANIDTVCIVTGLDQNFNVRRIERYITMVLDGGAAPVILLNKADLCPEADARKREVEAIAADIDVQTLCATQTAGIDVLKAYIQPGLTVAFVGSSGVGKSTMINALLGTNRLEVNDVIEEGSRGRHTTAFRELITLANGGMVIDTPGMRELQVWGVEDVQKQTFDDVEALALACRFRDCHHTNEPGCAVREAIASGALDPQRLESYVKLQLEFARIAKRQMLKAGGTEKSRWKKNDQSARNYKNDKL